MNPLFYSVLLLAVALVSLFSEHILRESWRARIPLLLSRGSRLKSNSTTGGNWTVDKSRQADYNADYREGVEPVQVVFSSTMKSVAGVEAAIHSIQRHTSGPVEFYFIGKEPLRPSSSTALQNASIHFFHLTQVAAEYNLLDYMNAGYAGRDDQINGMYAYYARFAVAELFERHGIHATKILYLDNDVIVLCDVHALVRQSLSDESANNYTIAAVPRYATRSHKNPIRGLHKHSEAKLRKEFCQITKSFNAGVYLMHLQRWRNQNISERIRELALRNREESLYRGGSQPPFNCIIGDNFEDLPKAWNSGASDYERYQRGESAEPVCLIHYKGGVHPWVNRKDFGAKDVWLRYGTQIAEDR